MKINYSNYYEKKSDVIPQNIIDILKSKRIDYGDFNKVKLRQVEEPFILADNEFDLREANNNIYEIGVKRVKTVTFPGGCYYAEYHKDGDSIIIQGNYDEGYNIFIIQ
jgi:hypothetical protein